MEALRELRECLTRLSSRSFFLSGRHVVANSFGVIDANSTFGLGNALAKLPAMQVVDVSGVNGTGVLRAGLVLTACGLCHVFRSAHSACTPDDDGASTAFARSRMLL